jgi:hypothetical protein
VHWSTQPGRDRPVSRRGGVLGKSWHTTEFPIVAALDRTAGMRVVQGPIHGWALRSHALVLNLGNGDLAVTVQRGYRGISAAMASREGHGHL